MKTPEELNTIKTELEALNEKLSSLADEELTQVAGGDYWDNIVMLPDDKNKKNWPFEK